MKIIFDTNNVPDVLLEREPFSTTAALLFAKVEKEGLSGYLCSTTISAVYYLTCKTSESSRTLEHIGQLLSLFEIAPVNRAILEGALRSPFADFEDGVIREASVHAGAKALVTHNSTYFGQTKIPVYSPDELFACISWIPAFPADRDHNHQEVKKGRLRMEPPIK